MQHALATTATVILSCALATPVATAAMAESGGHGDGGLQTGGARVGTIDAGKTPDLARGGALSSYFRDAILRVESAAVTNPRGSSAPSRRVGSKKGGHETVLAMPHAGDNPAMLAILASLGLSGDGSSGADVLAPGSGMLSVLALSTGEFELVIPQEADARDGWAEEGWSASRTRSQDGLVDSLPPFVCRFRLSASRAQKVAEDLAAARLTRPLREVAGFQTHTMAGDSLAGGSDSGHVTRAGHAGHAGHEPSSRAVRGRGARFEVVLLGEDLLIGSEPLHAGSNTDGTAERRLPQSPLEFVLSHQHAESFPQSLSAGSTHRDPDVSKTQSSSLRRCLAHAEGTPSVSFGARPSGSLTLSLNWKRLQRSLDDECEHAGAWLGRWAGLASVDQVVVQLTASRAGGSQATGGTQAAGGSGSGAGAVGDSTVRTAVWLKRSGDQSGSLLRASRKAPIDRLAAKLPLAGLGSLVVAVGDSGDADLEDFAAGSSETALRHDHESDEDGEDSTWVAEVDTLIKTPWWAVHMHQDDHHATVTVAARESGGVDELVASPASVEAAQALHRAIDLALDVASSTPDRAFEKHTADAVFRIQCKTGPYPTAHAGAIAVADDQILIRMVNVNEW